MFGRVRLKQLFRTPVKRDGSVRIVDTACHASNNVVISGSFIYLVQDSTIQVKQVSMAMGKVRIRGCADLRSGKMRMLSG